MNTTPLPDVDLATLRAWADAGEISTAQYAEEVERRRREQEQLRAAAHGAPMNRVFKDHKGRMSLGSHSMAWADASNKYMESLRVNGDLSGQAAIAQAVAFEALGEDSEPRT